MEDLGAEVLTSLEATGCSAPSGPSTMRVTQMRNGRYGRTGLNPAFELGRRFRGI